MVLTVLQVGLALVLLAAAGAKLVRTQDLAGALRLSGAGSTLARLLSRLVPAAEIGVAVYLLVARGAWLRIGFLISLGVIGAFTGWLVWVRLRRLDIRCNCFGATGRKVTGLTIARNGLLLAAVMAGLVLAGTRDPVLPDPSFLWLMTTICIAATILLLSAFNQVRHGLILSLESLHKRRTLSAGVET